jgi:hypothetical protein
MTNAPLPCPRCSAPLSPPEILEACSVTIPETGLLRFDCPRCGGHGFALLSDGRLELGAEATVGTPFRATATAAEPGLFVRRDAGWVDCWYRNVYRRYPVAV